MNIAVFGSTGGTGRQVVEQALAQGHQVTAFVRDPGRVPLQDPRLRLVVGDALDPDCVAEAVAGQEAVVVTLGGHGQKDPNVRAEGTANVIGAMQAQGVPRLVVVSAGGAGDSYQEVPFFLKALIKTVMKNTYTDHDRQERFIQESDLDWVIVRPAMLVDGPTTGRFNQGSADGGPPKSRVSRADVACFVLQQLTSDRYLRQAPSIP
jgi:putative NADH-flavin reductase